MNRETKRFVRLTAISSEPPSSNSSRAVLPVRTAPSKSLKQRAKAKTTRRTNVSAHWRAEQGKSSRLTVWYAKDRCWTLWFSTASQAHCSGARSLSFVAAAQSNNRVSRFDATTQTRGDGGGGGGCAPSPHDDDSCAILYVQCLRLPPFRVPLRARPASCVLWISSDVKPTNEPVGRHDKRSQHETASVVKARKTMRVQRCRVPPLKLASCFIFKRSVLHDENTQVKRASLVVCSLRSEPRNSTRYLQMCLNSSSNPCTRELFICGQKTTKKKKENEKNNNNNNKQQQQQYKVQWKQTNTTENKHQSK